jgi:Transposase IS200 like
MSLRGVIVVSESLKTTTITPFTWTGSRPIPGDIPSRYGPIVSMDNHVHFVSVPIEADSLTKVFNTLHMRYSQHTNRKTKATGHLWQGRFFSCILDEKHLYACIRYVENNPVRAGLVKRAEEYRWSSAASHVLRKDDPILSDDCPVKGGDRATRGD